MVKMVSKTSTLTGPLLHLAQPFNSVPLHYFIIFVRLLDRIWN